MHSPCGIAEQINDEDHPSILFFSGNVTFHLAKDTMATRVSHLRRIKVNVLRKSSPAICGTGLTALGKRSSCAVFLVMTMTCRFSVTQPL